MIGLISCYTSGDIEEQETLQNQITQFIQNLSKYERIIVGQDSNAQIGISTWSNEKTNNGHIGTHKQKT